MTATDACDRAHDLRSCCSVGAARLTPGRKSVFAADAGTDHHRYRIVPRGGTARARRLASMCSRRALSSWSASVRSSSKASWALPIGSSSSRTSRAGGPRAPCGARPAPRRRRRCRCWRRRRRPACRAARCREGARGPVEGVLELAGDRGVVLGGGDEQRVGGRDAGSQRARPAAGRARRRRPRSTGEGARGRCRAAARCRREEPAGGAQQRGVERARAQAARDAEDDHGQSASATSSRWTDSWTVHESTSPPRGSWAWKSCPSRGGRSRPRGPARRGARRRCPRPARGRCRWR